MARLLVSFVKVWNILIKEYCIVDNMHSKLVIQKHVMMDISNVISHQPQ